MGVWSCEGEGTALQIMINHGWVTLSSSSVQSEDNRNGFASDAN